MESIFPCLPGITPARAGKSGYQKFTDLALKDHPRACGEKCKHRLRWRRG